MSRHSGDVWDCPNIFCRIARWIFLVTGFFLSFIVVGHIIMWLYEKKP